MFRVFRQDEPSGPRPAGGAEPEWLGELLSSLEEAEPEEDRNLYCFVCGEAVTRIDKRISVQGTHQHTCTNPAGYVYKIGCFEEAEGCQQAGEPTEEFTWFAGYTWRFAFCGSCRTHLGWIYEGGTKAPEVFFGLILNRLVSGRQNFPSTS